MWQDLVQSAQSALNAVGNALSFAPPWAVSLVLLMGATAAAWSLHAAILAVLRRLLRGRRPYLRSVLDETRRPTRFALLLVALAIALPTAPLGSDTKSVIARVLVLGAICLLGWLAMTALHIAANLYLMRFRTDVEDNLLARKHVTQVRVLMRKVDRFPAARASGGAAAAPLRSRSECRVAIGGSARASHLTRALIANRGLRDQGCGDWSSAATIAVHSAANSPVAGARRARRYQ